MSVVPRDRPTAATPTRSPYVLARDLRFDTPEGPVFGPVDLTLDRSRVAVIQGPAGSGRSSLLLALTGRLRGWTGTLRVAGLHARADERRLRRRSSIARLADLVELEGRLQVGESITERALADGVRPARTERALGNAERRLGRTFERERLIKDLAPLDATLLAVTLATLRPSRLIVVDDVDARLALTDQEELYVQLPGLVPAGSMCVVSTLEDRSIPHGIPVHHLTGGDR